MGNKPDFAKIRHDNLERRDGQLLKFLPQFERIIKNANLSSEQV
jgi:hypothetical protein